MKHILIILLFTFPFLLNGQVDSTTFTKGVDGNWYKKDYLSQEVPQVYTNVDSLVKKTLITNQLDYSRQYREAFFAWQKLERQYLAKLRQNKNQHQLHFGSAIDIDSLANAKQLIGDWLLNDEAIVITKDLRIKTKKVTFVSDVQIEVTLDNVKKTLFRKDDNWISTDEKYKLVKVKKIR